MFIPSWARQQTADHDHTTIDYNKQRRQLSTKHVITVQIRDCSFSKHVMFKQDVLWGANVIPPFGKAATPRTWLEIGDRSSRKSITRKDRYGYRRNLFESGSGYNWQGMSNKVVRTNVPDFKSIRVRTPEISSTQLKGIAVKSPPLCSNRLRVESIKDRLQRVRLGLLRVHLDTSWYQSHLIRNHQTAKLRVHHPRQHVRIDRSFLWLLRIH